MVRVREFLDAFPFVEPPRVLDREEDLLLSPAAARPGPRFAEPAPLAAVHIGQTYEPLEFALPRSVYESDAGRIEWQQMDFRQPMYHRNLDVDELSYQIRGDRTLMTEMGTVHLEPGDWCRIPLGVCHDNRGRQESHLLFYVDAPCVECAPAVKRSEALLPPFEGWAPQIVNELHTMHKADLTEDTAALLAHQSDERLILGRALADPARLTVMRADDARAGTTWMWKSARLWIGVVDCAPTDGLDYRRHGNCDEVQYQISGRRTLVSQRGTLDLGPGDFVRIPQGTAFTTVAGEAGRYLVVDSTAAFDTVQVADRKARTADPAELRTLRAQRAQRVR